jgi:hypothetical protein
MEWSTMGKIKMEKNGEKNRAEWSGMEQNAEKNGAEWKAELSRME